MPTYSVFASAPPISSRHCAAAKGRRWPPPACSRPSPADLSLSLLLSPAAAGEWHWARWLPHLAGRVAPCEVDCAALVAELAADVERRICSRRLEAAGWSGPWHVMIIDRAARLAEVPGLATLLAKGRAAGLTAICLDEDEAALPTPCQVVARVAGVTGTRATVRQGGADVQGDVVVDRVSLGWAETLARGLAPIVDAGRTVPRRSRVLAGSWRRSEPRISILRSSSSGGARARAERTPLSECAPRDR